MSDKFVITPFTFESNDILLCGRMQEGRLIEVHLGPLPSDPCTVRDNSQPDPGLGDIYIGKVQRVLSSLNAAFVDIAPGLTCYLPLERVKDPLMVKSGSPGSVVLEDEIVVQISREAVQSKSPTLSSNLSFVGRYVILTTENKKIGFSSKLDGSRRDHIKTLLCGVVSDKFGLIVRTNAQHASDEDILSEISVLSEQMDGVVSRAANRRCYSCLYRHQPMYLTYLLNTYTDGLDEIITDIPGVYDELSQLCSRYSDLSGIPLKFYDDRDYPLVSLLNLNREMTRATAREVRLKSGGFLVIEPTEAMTVIDVNSGRSISKKDRSDHLFRINMEASREIARQLRLRNISGIVVVDYIDLDTASQKRELLEDLKTLVKSDPVPVQVHDITALNLVEITRKKAEKSLYEQIKQLTMKNAL